MWVDIDDLRAEIRSFAREAVEELYKEDEPYLALVSCHFGKLEGYKKVEQILDEMEEDYRKREDEYSRGMEEGNEEYVEPLKPEVDWNKVPVDTLVRVRDDEDNEWVPRYFVGIDENHKGRYVVWAGGATSKTSRGSTMHWMHCELVEDEDGGN